MRQQAIRYGLPSRLAGIRPVFASAAPGAQISPRKIGPTGSRAPDRRFPVRFRSCGHIILGKDPKRLFRPVPDDLVAWIGGSSGLLAARHSADDQGERSRRRHGSCDAAEGSWDWDQSGPGAHGAGNLPPRAEPGESGRQVQDDAAHRALDPHGGGVKILSVNAPYFLSDSRLIFATS